MSEAQSDSLPSAGLADQLIRVSDPDAAIYRIFPLWFFEEALRLRQLALALPSSWEDPLEVVGDAIAINKPGGEQVIINQSLPPAYAQCWSRTVESDSLLRAYSRVVKDPHFGRNVYPRDEGVRVRSTPRKLLQALVEGSPAGLTGHWFLGAVRYLPREPLLNWIADEIRQHGCRVFEAPPKRAELLLLKRPAFSQEAEIRVIFVQRDTEPRPPIIRVPIEPLSVFEEITFDPRLETFERKERETALRSLGYTGTITKSGLYQRTLLEINMGDEAGKKTPAA